MIDIIDVYFLLIIQRIGRVYRKIKLTMATMNWEEMIASIPPIKSWYEESERELSETGSPLPNPPIELPKKLEISKFEIKTDSNVICPKCGGKKGITYDLCYNCNASKYTCPKCNGKKTPMYEFCGHCAFSS